MEHGTLLFTSSAWHEVHLQVGGSLYVTFVLFFDAASYLFSWFLQQIFL